MSSLSQQYKLNKNWSLEPSGMFNCCYLVCEYCNIIAGEIHTLNFAYVNYRYIPCPHSPPEKIKEMALKIIKAEALSNMNIKI